MLRPCCLNPYTLHPDKPPIFPVTPTPPPPSHQVSTLHTFYTLLTSPDLCPFPHPPFPPSSNLHFPVSTLHTFYKLLTNPDLRSSPLHAPLLSFLSSTVRHLSALLPLRPSLFLRLLFHKSRKESMVLAADVALGELRSGGWVGGRVGGGDGEEGWEAVSGGKGRQRGGRGGGKAGERGGRENVRSGGLRDALGDDEADVELPRGMWWAADVADAAAAAAAAGKRVLVGNGSGSNSSSRRSTGRRGKGAVAKEVAKAMGGKFSVARLAQRIQFLGLPEDGMGRKRSERRRRGSASGFDEILKDMEDGEKRAGGEEEEEETKVEEGETEDEAGAGGEEERVGDEEGEEGEEEEGEDEKEEAESSEDEDNVLLSKRPKALIGSAAAAAAAAAAAVAAARVRRGRRALESSQEEAEISEDEENVLLSKRQRALAAAAKVRRGQRSDRRQRGGGAARGGEMPREQEAQEEEWATGSQADGGDGAMNLEGDQGAIVVPNSTAIAAGPVTGSALIGGATIASAAVGVEEKVELKEEAVREGVQLVLADDSFDGAEAIQWLQSRLKAAHASWTDAIARNSWQLLLMDGPDWPGRKGKKKGGKGKENGKKGKRRRGQEEEEEEEEGEGGEKEGDGGWGEVVHVDFPLVEELEDWDTVANDSMAQLLSAFCLKHPDEADGCWRVPGDRGTQWLLDAVSMLARMLYEGSSHAQFHPSLLCFLPPTSAVLEAS
ncbi:unnamed protein product [Closterium sp. NIES-53]